MADQIAVVTFTTPASPGTLDITSGSITEAFSAAILIFSKETTDDATNADAVIGMGFIGIDGTSGTSTQQVTISAQMEDAVSSQDGNTLRDPGSALEVAAVNVTPILIRATLDSAIPGGVRLSFATTTNRTKGVAILFAGLSKAATGQCTFDETGISHEDVGVTPFWEPDLVVFRSADSATNADSANATIALGFATNRSPIQQVSAYVNFDELAATSDSDGYIRSDACSAAFNGDRIVIMDRFAVTSFDSTGFNAQAADAGAGTQSPQANYLALKFTDPDVNISCDNLAVSSSTGVQSFAVGFQPQVVLGMSSLMTTEDSLIDGATASTAGYFAFNSTVARAHTACNQEGIGGTKAAKSRQGDHAVLTIDHTATVAQQASLSSMTATGFDLNFTTATAGYLTVLAIGAGAQTSIFNETEQISESVALMISLSAQETVEIADAFASITNLIVTDSYAYGLTLETGSRRGASLVSGAVAGSLL